MWTIHGGCRMFFCFSYLSDSTKLFQQCISITTTHKLCSQVASCNVFLDIIPKSHLTVHLFWLCRITWPLVETMDKVRHRQVVQSCDYLVFEERSKTVASTVRRFLFPILKQFGNVAVRKHLLEQKVDLLTWVVTVERKKRYLTTVSVQSESEFLSCSYF